MGPWWLALVACASKTPLPAGTLADPGAVQARAAATGVTDPALQALLVEDWERQLRRWPERALDLGDHRFRQDVFDPSPEAHGEHVAALERFIARARALPTDALSTQDALTRDLFVNARERDLAGEACRTQEWAISVRFNPLVTVSRMSADAPLETVEDGDALLVRLAAMPNVIAGEIDNLRRGAANGHVANKASIELIVQQIERELELPTADAGLMEPARGQRPASWTDAAWSTWTDDLADVWDATLRGALRQYAAFLRDELLPLARTGGDVGVHALPDGQACYAGLIEVFTTLQRTPEELHETGLAELRSIHAEFSRLGERVFGLTDVADVFERLRTDTSLYFDNEDEIVGVADSALRRAESVVPGFFSRLPEAACVVEPIPDYLAPYTTIAYYDRPRLDGSKPGIYFVNTYEPQTRPRYEAEVLAFHEAVPGHHFQIAIAQELGELPAFRRHSLVTAFVEGWALYTERLSDEMGLYSGDLDRLGMLSFDAWRAARLVVDTGIHAMGWSRQEAEDFMLGHTPLAENNIRNEVDRYITWPGQALGYKTGQLEIRRLRAMAEERLLERFDLAGFHATVLEAGAVSLPVLERRVLLWIEAEAKEDL